VEVEVEVEHHEVQPVTYCPTVPRQHVFSRFRRDGARTQESPPPVTEAGFEKVPRPDGEPTGASTTARATGAEILETYGGADGGGGTDPAAGRTAGLAADLTAERAMLDGREVERLA